MPIVDWSIEKLKKYKPKLNRQKDFDKFWKNTLAQSHRQLLRVREEKIDYPIKSIKVSKISFDGFVSGTTVGYYIRPNRSGKFPVIMVYHGYTVHKGFPHDYLPWLAMGCAVCTIDTRDQTGESTDGRSYGAGHILGWMTKGLESPEKYYYRGVYMDCVRAIDYVCSKPEIDTTHIAVTGSSQGGGLSLATAALDSRVKICMSDLPFLCHYRRALEAATGGPYLELLTFFKQHPHKEEQGWNTLSYFDNLNLADHIKARTLVTIGLQDVVCPPSTIFAVYNHIKAPKENIIYNYWAHDFFSLHTDFKLRWLLKQWRFLV